MLHRFERTIAGRPFVIEVTWVAEKALAGAHREDSRRSDGHDALLRRDAGRSGNPSERLAQPRPPAPGEYGIVQAALLTRMLRPFTKLPVLALMLTALMLGAVGGMDTWADNQLPRIRFIATGGTIATRGSTRMSAEEVLQLVPGLQRYAQPEPEQFANIASTAMTLDQWVQLAKRVNDIFDADSDLTGAVITSGTDSLEELAYFLHLTIRTVKAGRRRWRDAERRSAWL